MQVRAAAKNYCGSRRGQPADYPRMDFLRPRRALNSAWCFTLGRFAHRRLTLPSAATLARGAAAVPGSYLADGVREESDVSSLKQLYRTMAAIVSRAWSSPSCGTTGGPPDHEKVTWVVDGSGGVALWREPGQPAAL